MSKKKQFSLFGKGKKTKDASGLSMEQRCQDRAEEISQKIRMLNERVDYFERQAEHHRAEAKKFMQEKKPARAREALKQMKRVEAQRTQTYAISSNLQVQLDQITMAVLNIEGIKALEENTALLKGIMAENGLTPEKIDQIQDDAAEANQELEELARVVAMPLGPQLDDDELDQELQLLQNEIQEEAAAPAHVGPAPAHVAPGPMYVAPPPDVGDDDGMADLLDAFG